MNFPNDADGDALRKVAASSDMSRPMDVDFAVDVPDEVRGKEIGQLAVQLGYSVLVERDDSTTRWTCYCTKRLVPTYDSIIAAQKELDELSRPLGGHTDGWGTLGN
jgi:Regulator of ribonuclease activity B